MMKRALQAPIRLNTFGAIWKNWMTKSYVPADEGCRMESAASCITSDGIEKETFFISNMKLIYRKRELTY